MNLQDLEIVVPAQGEAIRGALPDEDESKRVILRFPVSVVAEPGLFDATLDHMLELAGRDQPVAAMEGWLTRQEITASADREMLVESYKAFCQLQSDGRNHIWGYVARNLSRPIWLATEKQKADIVLGNPPWLAYAKMSKTTKRRFKEEMEAAGLWGGLTSVSAFDLSSYFFARSVYLYMRRDGKIAFVMPYASMFKKPYCQISPRDLQATRVCRSTSSIFRCVEFSVGRSTALPAPKLRAFCRTMFCAGTFAKGNPAFRRPSSAT